MEMVVLLTRDNSAFSPLVRDKVGTHEPRNRISLSLTPNGDNNTHVVTPRSDKKVREKNLESTKVKRPLL